MFGRLLLAEGQSRATRSVEWWGWLILALGIIPNLLFKISDPAVTHMVATFSKVL